MTINVNNTYSSTTKTSIIDTGLSKNISPYYISWLVNEPVTMYEFPVVFYSQKEMNFSIITSWGVNESYLVTDYVAWISVPQENSDSIANGTVDLLVNGTLVKTHSVS